MKQARLLIAFALASACASAPPATGDDTEPAQESTPVESEAEPQRLTYGDMSEKRKSVEYTFAGKDSLPRRSMGYEGEVDIREIDGVELQALFDKRGQDPADQMPSELTELVGRKDARFLLLDYEQHPAVAEELVFVFPPESGFDYSRVPDYLRKGFLIMLGIEWPDREQNESLPEAPTPGDEELEIPVADVEMLQKKMEAGDDFAVFISAEGCGNVPPYRAILETSLTSPEMKGKLFDLPIEAEDEETYKRRVEFAETLLPSLAFPSLVVFRDGKPVDWQSGGRDYWVIQHAFARNGLIDAKSEWVFDYTGEPDNREYWLRGFSNRGNFSAGKLDGLDLSGLYMTAGTFAGASLRNVDLSNAVLSETSFAYADLTGANLTGADLTDAHWYKTTCPDGKSSEEHGGACPVPETEGAAD